MRIIPRLNIKVRILVNLFTSTTLLDKDDILVEINHHDTVMASIVTKVLIVGKCQWRMETLLYYNVV